MLGIRAYWQNQCFSRIFRKSKQLGNLCFQYYFGLKLPATRVRLERYSFPLSTEEDKVHWRKRRTCLESGPFLDLKAKSCRPGVGDLQESDCQKKKLRCRQWQTILVFVSGNVDGYKSWFWPLLPQLKIDLVFNRLVYLPDRWDQKRSAWSLESCCQFTWTS